MTPPPADPLRPFRALIQDAAMRIQWDPDLLAAQVLVESAGDPWAFRSEPTFFLTRIKGTPHAVPWGPIAACSFGLMQVLYVTAKEDGFTGPPYELFDPALNLAAGCTHLHKLRRTLCQSDPHRHNLLLQDGKPTDLLRATLAQFNGGTHGNRVPPYRNVRYVEKVLEHWQTLRA